jgi:hypothetical protein
MIFETVMRSLFLEIRTQIQIIFGIAPPIKEFKTLKNTNFDGVKEISHSFLNIPPYRNYFIPAYFVRVYFLLSLRICVPQIPFLPRATDELSVSKIAASSL